jgi:hypothetical protein
MTFTQLLKHFKTQTAAAQAIGVRQPTISMWNTRGKIPGLQQIRIENITNGALKADPKILGKRKISHA